MRRVAVTGFGTVSPFGIGATQSWNRLIKGDIAITKLTDPSMIIKNYLYFYSY